MLTLEQLMEEWKQDSVIDKILIDESTLRICSLHQKYLDYLNTFKQQKRFLSRQKKEFPVTERRESNQYDHICEMLAQMDDAIYSTESIIHSINQMGFHLNTICKWRIFTNGTDASL